MCEDDLEEVCSIENKMFSKPWSKSDFFTSMKNRQNIYLVAEEPQGEIVGYCGCWGVVDEGQITNVAVKPEARCKGIGTEMLKELIRIGRDEGLLQFTLEVRESNMQAIRLYEKLGFSSAGIRKNFYEAPLENAVIMWLTDDNSSGCMRNRD
ncbi:ribosomal protein S18-alanine N-acetyltransferase [Anaeromicropila populeti]|nr:ribosomal protein S18-alanine N-acetyltransferase [Anaeromicropila populeti]